ncbi:hypothetical protein [Streptomyces sp. NPDC004284]|uniref:hypothetical protein n=1 Tax=Streptomyces sp. NPDC004284 TaxID=3364695 RepID=UPI0036ACA16C
MRWAKTRRRVEHDYRELKHGLGLDRFEGRTWRGLHQHVTLVTAAHAFLVLRAARPRSPHAGLTLYSGCRRFESCRGTGEGVYSSWYAPFGIGG